MSKIGNCCNLGKLKVNTNKLNKKYSHEKASRQHFRFSTEIPVGKSKSKMIKFKIK